MRADAIDTHTLRAIRRPAGPAPQKREGLAMTDGSGGHERTRFVEDLLSYLTLEEKLGQLDLFHDGSDPALEQRIVEGRIGGVVGASAPSRLQALAAERSRLGIPLLMSGVEEQPSGLSPWALAASWDDDLASAIGAAAARANRRHGYNCMLMPGVSPRRWAACSKAHIASCEPLLSARLAAACASGARERAVLAIPNWQGDSDAEGLGWAIALANTGNVEAIDCAAFTSMSAQRLGFAGLLVDECRRICDLVAHHFAKSRARSQLESVDQVLAHGLVTDAEVDMAVRGVLTAKHAMGLFRSPERIVTSQQPQTSAAHYEHVLRRTMVLLRNEAGVLPFSPVSDRVLVVGPSDGAASACANALGRAGIGYSCAPGLAQRRSGEPWVVPASGDGFALSLTVDAARRADFVVVVLDERHFVSHDDGEWRRPSVAAVAMLNGLARSGTRIVAILATAEPVDLAATDQFFTAVLQSWASTPGYEEALCDILSGRLSPQGRMPIGAGRYQSGHGLGYGEAVYSGLVLNPRANHIVARVAVRNSGAFAMRETVQVYARSPSEELRLIAFKHVDLAPGEAQVVECALGMDALGTPGVNQSLKLEPGHYEILVGKSRAQLLSSSVEISPTLARTIAKRDGGYLRLATG